MRFNLIFVDDLKGRRLYFAGSLRWSYKIQEAYIYDETEPNQLSRLVKGLNFFNSEGIEARVDSIPAKSICTDISYRLSHQ